ncbi:MAG: hypothetical protein ACXAES_07565 [Promethearchaeota archaeon]
MVSPSDINRRRSFSPSTIRKFSLAISIIVIILISFLTSTPIPDFKFGIVKFSTLDDKKFLKGMSGLV